MAVLAFLLALRLVRFRHILRRELIDLDVVLLRQADDRTHGVVRLAFQLRGADFFGSGRRRLRCAIRRDLHAQADG